MNPWSYGRGDRAPLPLNTRPSVSTGDTSSAALCKALTRAASVPAQKQSPAWSPPRPRSRKLRTGAAGAASSRQVGAHVRWENTGRGPGARADGSRLMDAGTGVQNTALRRASAERTTHVAGSEHDSLSCACHRAFEEEPARVSGAVASASKTRLRAWARRRARRGPPSRNPPR
jgi:hypothetical protein